MASSPCVFDRLVGLETEYAIRFHPTDAKAPLPTKFQLYHALVDAVRRRVLTAEAKHFKEGVFTANGGAIWFEAEKPAAGAGLIEGSTPECRGPRQLLRYQRAQEQLLSDAAKAALVDGQFCLIKNDRDSRDNVYGAQENYETTLATGWRLQLWRAGLVLLLPLLLVTWVGFLLLILGMLLYLAVAGILYLPLQALAQKPRSVALMLFGRDLVEGRETGGPAPPWLEALVLSLTRAITAPLAAGLIVLAWVTAFVPVRRQMLPFLISRPILAGAGMLDADGNFHLADKAPAINCVLGFGGFLRDRPVITIGHFFKTLCVEAWFSPRDYLGLFAERQRLQIGLGDSNMADVAEYLRVGTTMLVLDVIEAGELPRVPRVRRPIRTLHRICRDLSLQAPLDLARGRRWTALEMQRFYLEACRRFLQRRAHAPAEAYQVLRLWEETLDALQCAPETLVGSIDWITKKYLLDEAGPDASWPQRKKIDIRYHELSPDGYYHRLKAAGLAERLVEAEEIDRAIRTAPSDTPATTRGHYIREFADGSEHVSVNWKSVAIGQGLAARVIRLDRYGRSSASRSSDRPSAHHETS